MTLMIALSETAFALESTLDQYEQNRATSFQFKHLQEQYVFAHSFKRLLLSKYFPYCTAEEWSFSISQTGKPAINLPSSLSLTWPLT